MIDEIDGAVPGVGRVVAGLLRANVYRVRVWNVDEGGRMGIVEAWTTEGGKELRGGGGC